LLLELWTLCTAERIWAWLATVELPAEVEERLKKLGKVMDGSLSVADSCNARESLMRGTQKGAVPVQQRGRVRGFSRWFSCFVGGERL
jgi:hypothetical protein